MNLTLTNNFYAWMRTILLQTGTTIGTDTTVTIGHYSAGLKVLGKMIDDTGTEQNIISCGYKSSSYDYAPYQWSNMTLNAWKSGITGTDPLQDYTYFAIGNSNTAATADDYNLSGNYVLNTDYSASWKALSNPSIVNNKGVLTFNFSVTAINPIEIGEIGMFKSLCYANTKNSRTAVYNALFGRATLDAPITLASGESATFQITVEI